MEIKQWFPPMLVEVTKELEELCKRDLPDVPMYHEEGYFTCRVCSIKLQNKSKFCHNCGQRLITFEE